MKRVSRAGVLSAYRDGVTVICELAAQVTGGTWLAATPCAERRAVDLAPTCAAWPMIATNISMTPEPGAHAEPGAQDEPEGPAEPDCYEHLAVPGDHRPGHGLPQPRLGPPQLEPDPMPGPGPGPRQNGLAAMESMLTGAELLMVGSGEEEAW